MSSERQVSEDVAKAALTLSREHVADDAAARDVLGRLDDLDDLISLSVAMFSLPMVAQNLARLVPDRFDPATTRPIEMQFALGNMTLRAEQRAFYKRCIEPVGHGYAFIKGFALADQFYEKPIMRFARDIDVLVRRHVIVEIVELALDQGYELLDIVDHSKTLKSRQDIRAALRYQQVFNLVSPKGRHIEVHREVDKHQGIFDERRLLFETHKLPFYDSNIQTLNPIDHFLYVAYHCARHNWSKLHWLADLAAMARSPLIERDALAERASDMGLEGLIDETLGFVALSATPDTVDPDAPGARILTRVIDIARNGERRANDLANSQAATALPFPDMLSPWLRKKVRARRLWGRMKPHISDYHTWPLPEQWQWLYWVAGPTRRVLRKNSS